MRAADMWAVAGRLVLIGIHNKCVVECLSVDPSWDKAGFEAE